MKTLATLCFLSIAIWQLVCGGQAAASTVELLANRGFESGDNGIWIANTLAGPTAAAVINGSFPHAPGSWYGYVGNSTSSIGSLFQVFSVPACAGIATVTFYLNVASSETTTMNVNDVMDVSLRKYSPDELISKLGTFSNLNKAAAGVYAQRQFTYDLTDSRSQLILLQFYAVNNPSLPTIFRIDDVSVVVTIDDVPVPIAPSGLIAVGTNTSVLLGWTDNSANESGFRIERKLGPSGSFSEIALTLANQRVYEDKNLTYGQEYCYRVRAYNCAGNSPYSNERCATPLATPQLTAPPDGTTLAGSSVTLQCSSVSAANGYSFQVGTTCGGTDVASGANSLPGFDISNLPNGHYYWRVLAANAGQGADGVSSWSTCWSFNISALSLAVSSPNGGNPLLSGQTYPVSFQISGDTSAINHFDLAYSTDAGTTWNPIPGTIPSTARTGPWTVAYCISTSFGRLRVRALNAGGTVLATGVNPANLTISDPSFGPPIALIAGEQATSPGRPTLYRSRGVTGSCYTYAWSTRDGQHASTPNATFTFNTPGANWVQLVVSDPLVGTSDTASISINVQPQTVGTGGGGSSGNTYPTMGADPVNLASGNYTYQHTDIHLPGIGMPLEFQRFYNSTLASQDPFPFGYGWSFGPSITVTGTSTNAVVAYADGHTESYTNTSGVYLGAPGVFDQLIKNIDSTWLLISKDQTTNRLDINGRLFSRTDRNGNTTDLVYDPATGRLSAITNAARRFLLVNPYPGDANRIGSIQDLLGRRISFEYDANTNLTAVTNALGGVTRFAYNDKHQLTDLWDNRGTLVIHNDYDTNRNVVVHQCDALTNDVLLAYDFTNRLSIQTNALGKLSTYHFDENLLLTNLVDESVIAQASAYDTNRNRAYVRDKNGNETHYAYDTLGNVTNRGDALEHLTSIAYDARNNPTMRLDSLLNTTTLGYDNQGNLTSTTNSLNHVSSVQYDPRGLPIVLTDFRGFNTTNEYDTRGNLITVIDAKGASNRFEYDAAGRKMRQIDPLNHTNFFFYDANDNLLSIVDPLGFTNSFTYDANKNRTSSRDPRGATITNLFDSKDRLVAVIAPLNHTNGILYDSLDRKVATFDAFGNPTLYSYDDIGNLIASTNALNEVTRFTYDPQGNQTSIIDPTGHFVTNLFDPLNRKSATINVSICTNATLYDSLGCITARTNANGQVTRFNYDPIGRLTNVVDAANQSVFFAYDENGNRIRTTDPNGHTWTNVFDELNRLIEQDDPRGNKTVFRYDPAGNLTNKITPNGDSVVYGYDALNRMTNISYPTNAPVTFAYDPVGNRTKMVDGLGTTISQYDLLNRLVSVTDPYDQSITNVFDANGNRISVGYPGGKVVHYGFDILNRLKAFTNWLGGIVTYSYDSRGNLVNTTNADGTTAIYGYDLADRIIALTNSGQDANIIAAYALSLDGLGNHTQAINQQPLIPVLLNQTNIYSYDSDNRLTSVDGEAVIHNLNGDLTAIGASTFAYDVESRLTQFTLTNISGTCTYDGLGTRLARTVGGQTRRFVVDRMGSLTQILVEIDTNDVPVAYYVHGLGLAQRISPEGEVVTYHYNIQGSTVALTDSGGNVTDSYAYDSFGVLANSDGNSPQPFRYLGRYGILDDRTGLLCARARYFSPQLGRFLTKDPITGKDSDGQSLNLYLYALNNPISLVDINGLSPEELQSTPIIGFCSDSGQSVWVKGNDGRPSFLVSLIPVYGSARLAIYDFQTGHYFWGSVNTVMAVSDVFLVKSLATAIAKVGVEVFVEETAERGFQSFSAFKNEFGSAGKGFEWHHIVEQHSSNIQKFGSEAIHNTGNLIPAPYDPHRALSGFYSSIQEFTGGQTVREWLKSKSFSEQFEFGIERMREFGIIK
jgi:RHS repeat-associated protein